MFSAAARQGILPTGTVQVDPGVRPYLDLWPIPGQGNALVEDFGDGTVRIAGTARRPVNSDVVGSRADYQSSNEKLGFLSGTYNREHSELLPSDMLGHLTSSGTSSTNQTLAVSLTSIFSPITLGEFNFGYSYNNIFDALPPPDLEFGNLPFITGKKRLGQIDPGGSVATIGWRNDLITFRQQALQFKYGLSSTHGHHSFRLGSEIKRFRFLQSSCVAGCFGVWRFRGVRQFLTNDVRDLRLFAPGHETPERNLSQILFGAYFQDNWQVRPSLTLNLGLRYEFTTVPKEDNNLVASLVNFTDPNLSAPKEAQARYPDSVFAGTTNEFFTNPTLKSFSPRIGFAWAPGDRKTSLRGGVGIFYEYPMLFSIITSLQQLPPFTIVGTVAANAAAAAGLPLRMQPGGGFERYGALAVAAPVARYIEHENSNTTMYRWSLTLQQQLMRDLVVSAGYTGTRGIHLWRQSLSNLCHRSEAIPRSGPGVQLHQPQLQRVANPFLQRHHQLPRIGRGRATAAFPWFPVPVGLQLLQNH